MTTTLRIDDELKRESDYVFNQLGLTMSAAMTMFLKQVVRLRGIPFPIVADEPNAETRKTLDAVLCGKEKLHGPFKSVRAMMKDVTRA